MANDLLRKFFFRSESSEQPTTGYDSLKDDAAAQMAAEYRSIIQFQIERWDVPPACVNVEVRQLAARPDGLELFVGLVRLCAWDRSPTLRLMLGLPMLEDRVRQITSTSWLSEVSCFGGLWLHAGGDIRSPMAVAELRKLVLDLTGTHAQLDPKAP